MIKEKKRIAPTATIASHIINTLYSKVTSHIDEAKQNIQRTVNTEMVTTYWLIGRDIIEEEQTGEKRAKYGKSILKQLSQRLQKKYKHGFGVDTLEQARKFYLTYHGDSLPTK